jgi:putative ABC transport system permease protein
MINISSTLKISIRALRVNKMRSALTMLGVIIGVGAVIAMLAVGKGASMELQKQISSIGSNIIIVIPGFTTASGVRMGSGSRSTLTMADADAILKDCPAVSEVAPIHSGNAQVVYGNQNWATGITGSTPSILSVRDWSLSAGRSLTEQDVKNASKVCLLGQTVVDYLFGAIDPVGQIVRIKKIPFKVVGVLNIKGQTPLGQDQDDTVFVPVTTAQKKLFGTTSPGMVRYIVVKAKDKGSLASAEDQMDKLLRQRHRIGPKDDDDFTVRNITQYMEMAEQASKVMAILLGSIASVSLLVGGIGIMNIMLVSVTERTREIGIRMAVGAKTWDIRFQFMIEAIMLSFIGGIAGIGVGILVSNILAKTAGWNTVIEINSIILAFGFSGLVGVLFGYYPAHKASLLEPIEALRYE